MQDSGILHYKVLNVETYTFKGRKDVIKNYFLSREMAFARTNLYQMRSGSRPHLSNAPIKTLTGN